MRMCKISNEVNKSKVEKALALISHPTTLCLQLYNFCTFYDQQPWHTNHHRRLCVINIVFLGFNVLESCRPICVIRHHPTFWMNFLRFCERPSTTTFEKYIRGKTPHLPSEPYHPTPLAAVEGTRTDGTFPFKCRR